MIDPLPRANPKSDRERTIPLLHVERAEIWHEATQIYFVYETYAPRPNGKMPVMELTPKLEDA